MQDRIQFSGDATRSSIENSDSVIDTSSHSAKSESLAGAGKKMQVLIIEDHEDTRRALERFVTACGFDVATAQDLESGRHLLQDHDFGAIVSDIALPDGTGYALISEARRRGVNTLAIALSAYNYPPDVEEAKLTGFDYHLRKPIDLPQLRHLLETAAARS
jgi:CheY-like chemotaxis protein